MLHLRRHSKINLSMLDETLKSTHTSLDGVRKRTAACCRLVRAISSDQGRYGTAAEARSANLTLLTLTPAAHLHIHLYVYIDIYTHVYVCICMCIYIYILHIHLHICMYMCVGLNTQHFHLKSTPPKQGEGRLGATNPPTGAPNPVM